MNAEPKIAKIKLKVGSMELEYEGDPSFLTGGIEALLVTMGDLVGKAPDEPSPVVVPAAHVQPANGNGNGNGVGVIGGQFNFSTNTIAAHLGANSCPELVICAMAQLELVQGRTASGRAAILAEMKSATSYFNENMRKNMSAALSSLTKSKRINQISTDSYALSATEKKKVEAKVADIS